jgi:hypothetical protein
MIVVGLVFTFMVGIWTIDVSAPWVNQNAVATSGWWDRTPVQSYHVGLYITIISFLLLTLIAVYHICKKEKSWLKEKS